MAGGGQGVAQPLGVLERCALIQLPASQQPHREWIVHRLVSSEYRAPGQLTGFGAYYFLP